jgi:hypothetical protein
MDGSGELVVTKEKGTEEPAVVIPPTAIRLHASFGPEFEVVMTDYLRILLVNPENSEAEALLAGLELTDRSYLFAFGDVLAAAVEQGQEPDATMLARAAAAGVLSPELVAAQGRAVEPLSVEDTCNWLRRIDEREPGEDDPLVVEIALAALPAEQRRLLLQRVQHTAALPPQQRCSMSRTLWNRYREGCFGCPGDAESMLTLGRLQEEALIRMTTQPEKETTRWLEELGTNADAWLCFDEQ